MTNEEYLTQVEKILIQEEIEDHLQNQILETVRELLDHYSVEFVRDLLPTLFE